MQARSVAVFYPTLKGTLIKLHEAYRDASTARDKPPAMN